MTTRPAAVISDANVLIDYISPERTLALRLVSEHLFPIKLPRFILNEVDPFAPYPKQPVHPARAY